MNAIIDLCMIDVLVSTFMKASARTDPAVAAMASLEDEAPARTRSESSSKRSYKSCKSH